MSLSLDQFLATTFALTKKELNSDVEVIYNNGILWNAYDTYQSVIFSKHLILNSKKKSLVDRQQIIKQLEAQGLNQKLFKTVLYDFWFGGGGGVTIYNEKEKIEFLSNYEPIRCGFFWQEYKKSKLIEIKDGQLYYQKQLITGAHYQVLKDYDNFDNTYSVVDKCYHQLKSYNHLSRYVLDQTKTNFQRNMFLKIGDELLGKPKDGELPTETAIRQANAINTFKVVKEKIASLFKQKIGEPKVIQSGIEPIFVDNPTDLEKLVKLKDGIIKEIALACNVPASSLGIANSSNKAQSEQDRDNLTSQATVYTNIFVEIANYWLSQFYPDYVDDLYFTWQENETDESLKIREQNLGIFEFYSNNAGILSGLGVTANKQKLVELANSISIPDLFQIVDVPVSESNLKSRGLIYDLDPNPYNGSGVVQIAGERFNPIPLAENIQRMIDIKTTIDKKEYGENPDNLSFYLEGDCNFQTSKGAYSGTLKLNSDGNMDINIAGAEAIWTRKSENNNNLPDKIRDGTKQKKYIEWQGRKIGVQYSIGDTRHGKKMSSMYGYLVNHRGDDKMALDCYIGGDISSTRIFKVSQIDPTTNQLDEYKFMLGFRTIEEAKKAYLNQIPIKFFGGIEETNSFNLDSYRVKEDVKPDEDFFYTNINKTRAVDTSDLVSIQYDDILENQDYTTSQQTINDKVKKYIELSIIAFKKNKKSLKLEDFLSVDEFRKQLEGQRDVLFETFNQENNQDIQTLKSIQDKIDEAVQLTYYGDNKDYKGLASSIDTEIKNGRKYKEIVDSTLTSIESNLFIPLFNEGLEELNKAIGNNYIATISQNDKNVRESHLLGSNKIHKLGFNEYWTEPGCRCYRYYGTLNQVLKAGFSNPNNYQ